jgi:hypothetical protein
MCNFTVLFKYRKKLNILDLFNNAFSVSEDKSSYWIKLGPKQTHIQVAQNGHQYQIFSKTIIPFRSQNMGVNTHYLLFFYILLKRE